jgi:cobalt-zinc-cadmium efflux system membrane fusion protein
MMQRPFLLAALVVAACSPSKADDSAGPGSPAQRPSGGYSVTAQQREKIHLQTVTQSTFQPTIYATGSVAFNGDRSTQVLATIGGPVTRILVQLGAYVAKGTPLADVSSPDFATAVATYLKAQASARNLRRIADLNQQLFKNDALARRDLEQSETDAASAEADRDAAIQQMRSLGVDEETIDAIRNGRPTGQVQSVIRAPISGVVVQKLITPGQLLAAGTTPCFTIADLSTMWVMANVFATDIGLVTKGEHATVTTDASPHPIAGTVDYVEALVDSATNATTVRVLVPNPGEILKQEMYVRVTIHSSRQTQGVLVSNMAVLRDDDNLPFVFIALPDGSFDRRRITLGPLVGDAYEVMSGLVTGDQVVTEGALFLQFAQSQ